MEIRTTNYPISFKGKNPAHTNISAHAAETIDFLLLLELQSLVSPPTLISPVSSGSD